MNFEPHAISETGTHEVIHPFQSKLTSLKKSTEHKYYLSRWKFHFPRQNQVRPMIREFYALSKKGLYGDPSGIANPNPLGRNSSGMDWALHPDFGM